MTTNTSSSKPLFPRLFRFCSALLGSLVLLSCTSMMPDCNVCSSPPLADLEGKWVLVRWNSPPQNGQIRFRTIPQSPASDPLFIQFDSSKQALSGYSGCNNFFSQLTFDSKGAIQLGSIGSTRKMCMENQRNEIERDFYNVLEDYRSWQQKQNQLLLFGRSGDVLVFVRTKTQ